MKYSVIIPYRDRLEHLKRVVPEIRTTLQNNHKECEIIVIEQYDNEKFRRAQTLNEGAKVATGDILVLHDVDYMPIRVAYHDENSDVYLPVTRVEFVNNDLTPRPENDIPSGYRNFHHKVDDDFYGGVISFKKDAFFKCGGFNPLFVGWGFEDADLRERIKYHNLSLKRAENNLFFALEHPDSAPPMGDRGLANNMRIFSMWKNYVHFGANNQICSKFSVNPLVNGIDQWIQITDFDLKYTN